MQRRYVIVGAGAVGGAIGGALSLAGSEVLLIARGAHLEALRERGLTLVTPDVTHLLSIPAYASAGELTLGDRDVVIVATKSQDTASALASIHRTSTPIVCAQNGVGNERIAQERFENVYGMVVYAPLQHLAPGVVSIHAAPHHGGLDIGRFPTGRDTVVEDLCVDLRPAGFDVRARSDIARWKYGKLLSNLGNVLEALGGRAVMKREWLAAMSAEAEACFRAAHIDSVSVADVLDRFAGIREVGARGGGSSWQSLHRGQPLETEHLNGEIVRLGAAHGVATPINAALTRLARRATEEHWAPASRTIDELEAELGP